MTSSNLVLHREVRRFRVLQILVHLGAPAKTSDVCPPYDIRPQAAMKSFWWYIVGTRSLVTLTVNPAPKRTGPL
jgi:hypothetical protein